MNNSIAASVVGVGVGLIAATWLLHAKNQRRMPISTRPTENWEYIGRLKEITLYPLRSAAGAVVEKAVCNKLGLSWLDISNNLLFLMSDAGQIITASVYPEMLSIKPKIISRNIIQMMAPKPKAPLVLDIKRLIKNASIENKHINGVFMRIIECTNEQHEWFSQVILKRAKGLRLYIVVDRHPDFHWWRNLPLWNVPVMAIHDKSIEDLNKRLIDVDKASHKQFHGNLLIETADILEPFDEDKWMWMKIGRNAIFQFRSSSICDASVNINTDTFQRNAHGQPFNELRIYRDEGNSSKPAMGQFFNVYQPGSIRKVDLVCVQYIDEY